MRPRPLALEAAAEGAATVITNDDELERDGRTHRSSAAYRRRPDAERQQMVEKHLGLARHLARRYADSGEPLDDLVQVASIGLLKAVDRFDPERGVNFSSYAVPTILGELRRHFRDRGWAIHVPRDLKEASLRVDKALRAHVGRAPTPAELARATGLDVEAVLEALEVSGAHRALSLDAPARGGGEDEQATMADRLGGNDAELARARDRATLEQLARALEPREREILRLRFEEDLTQSEIGERIGVSQMHVSRLIRTALMRMRLESQANPTRG
ncbi:SigB/SigF/SigG family RNA polymerase sigma factor [Conexibacter stalactiti]|uniref:SigB/SigF/SigG family RNA polymerase sigma factor n=1 Tax=Conexibacter stalactiti TaxID=1940611 RepID=A0ABU4HK52_9ACTN|nr:SigB/SigF/SigG family RNA polymerase sigma factor [Conexibacter stalactiti]MDW5593680.1 SigB/SigF/SigG family RNA polymerase sigma factor [Conexibacter stalactiti]MEC5034321.1 SigB/SigF/SigG family RNA polymerase sigma factor [Conexibacter stalactiti]